MPSHVTVMQVRRGIGGILNRVDLLQEEFLVERKGRPLAALVPVRRLERLEALARERLLDVLHRRKGGGLSEAAASRLANEAKHRSRK